VDCSVQRCYRRAEVAGMCKTHARDKADTLFSRFIRNRDGQCQAVGDHAGILQCAHIIIRSYHAIRFEPMNAVALCAGHHVYFTERPVHWEEWVKLQIGPTEYERLRRRALDDRPPDLAEVIAHLEEVVLEQQTGS
jgi:hypothetical protein